MDEGLGDEVAPIDVVERARLLSKENEYSLKPLESSSLLESHEVLIPGDGYYPGGSFHSVVDILEGKDVNRSVDPQDASDCPCASPQYMNDAGNMVEELMVRDYGSNLAIVGTSNNRERIQTRQSQWRHLYQLGGGSGSGSSCGRNAHRDNGQPAPSDWEDWVHLSFSEFLGQNTSNGGQQEAMELLPNAEIIEDSNRAVSHQGIRSKILSKSGFSEFFIKNILKGKGIIFGGPPHNSMRSELRDQHSGKPADGASVAPDTSPIPTAKTAIPSSFGTAGQTHGGSDLDDRNLREWLNAAMHKVSKVECLHIFRQIVDFVDKSHSQGIILCDLRPSCFKLLQSNQVKYLGPPVRKDAPEISADQDLHYPENCLIRRRPMQQEDGNQGFRNCWLSNAASQQLTSVTDHSEEKCYLSPEELAGEICSISSNIYSLGVLLFELLGRFDSERARAMAMSDLRHRILPPQFLSENVKEAGFCLWLLHPEPSSRPTTREILQSEVISGLLEVSAKKLSSSIEQDDAESDLLMHFLVSLREQKQKHASKLAEDVRCLEKDIEEVVKRNYLKEPLAVACMDSTFPDSNEPAFQHKEFETSEVLVQLSSSSTMKEVRFMSNMNQLESAYTTMRSKIQPPETGDTSREDKELLRNQEREYASQKGIERQISTDYLGNFFDGLCKYARYSKFEVRELLRTGDFNNSANVICSLSFDRDAEYFAAAGISKKIKIFEFNALLNDSVGIHYPVIEMSNKSKLSCICWNNYIKNYLASTGYDGVVKLWDVSTGQGVFQFSEHEKRAWSVDFSPVYPTKFASGSDDCSVKLWNINEKNSSGTIRNIANVCCVQFSSHSTHLLAFGSADYRTYCYDLRNLRTPWCMLAGHEKAVSYVKFLDPETLVTASTDNSLKLWDLNKTSSIGVSSGACSLTLSGHTNEKNFVGLSVANGYIACGSETNEVYAYYRSLPMPITSHKFGSIDPISGRETDDDNGQFVSSVCWRGDTDMVLAANSSGCIKVLQMV